MSRGGPAAAGGADALADMSAGRMAGWIVWFCPVIGPGSPSPSACWLPPDRGLVPALVEEATRRAANRLSHRWARLPRRGADRGPGAPDCRRGVCSAQPRPGHRGDLRRAAPIPIWLWALPRRGRPRMGAHPGWMTLTMRRCKQPDGPAGCTRPGHQAVAGRQLPPTIRSSSWSYPGIGWTPARSSRLTRIMAIVTISASSMIPADTSNPREKPTASA